MWMVVWMIIGMLAVASIPILVVGAWYVIMTLILGIADAGNWIFDLGSKMICGRKNRSSFIPMLTSGDINANAKKAPVSTLTALIPVDRPVTL